MTQNIRVNSYIQIPTMEDKQESIVYERGNRMMEEFGKPIRQNSSNSQNSQPYSRGVQNQNLYNKYQEQLQMFDNSNVEVKNQQDWGKEININQNQINVNDNQQNFEYKQYIRFQNQQNQMNNINQHQRLSYNKNIDQNQLNNQKFQEKKFDNGVFSGLKQQPINYAQNVNLNEISSQQNNYNTKDEQNQNQLLKLQPFGNKSVIQNEQIKQTQANTNKYDNLSLAPTLDRVVSPHQYRDEVNKWDSKEINEKKLKKLQQQTKSISPPSSLTIQNKYMMNFQEDQKLEQQQLYAQHKFQMVELEKNLNYQTTVVTPPKVQNTTRYVNNQEQPKRYIFNQEQIQSEVALQKPEMLQLPIIQLLPINQATTYPDPSTLIENQYEEKLQKNRVMPNRLQEKMQEKAVPLKQKYTQQVKKFETKDDLLTEINNILENESEKITRSSKKGEIYAAEREISHEKFVKQDETFKQRRNKIDEQLKGIDLKTRNKDNLLVDETYRQRRYQIDDQLKEIEQKTGKKDNLLQEIEALNQVILEKDKIILQMARTKRLQNEKNLKQQEVKFENQYGSNNSNNIDMSQYEYRDYTEKHNKHEDELGLTKIDSMDINDYRVNDVNQLSQKNQRGSSFERKQKTPLERNKTPTKSLAQPDFKSQYKENSDSSVREKELQQDLINLNKVIIEKNKEIEQFKQIIDEFKEGNIKFSDHFEIELQEKLKLQEEIIRYDSKYEIQPYYQNLTKQIETLQQMNSVQRNQIVQNDYKKEKNLTDQIKKQEEDKNQLIQQLNECKDQLKQLKEKFKNHTNDQVDNLKNLTNQLQDQIHQLQQENYQLKEAIDQIEEAYQLEQAQIKYKLEDKDKKIQELLDKLNLHFSGDENVKSMINDDENYNNIRRECFKLQKDNETLAKEINTKNGQIQQLNQIIQNQFKEPDQNKNELGIMKQHLVNAIEEAKQKDQHINEKNELIRKLLEELNEMSKINNVQATPSILKKNQQINLSPSQMPYYESKKLHFTSPMNNNSNGSSGHLYHSNKSDKKKKRDTFDEFKIQDMIEVSRSYDSHPIQQYNSFEHKKVSMNLQ